MNRAGWTGEPETVGASGDTAIKYTEALTWLYGLQRFGIKLGLENVRRLIDRVQIDLDKTRVVHVAGTNGKGSVCAMIESICRAAKYRTGLFTSPHLVTFRERIRLNNEMISHSDVAIGLTRIRELVSDWDPHPTFFEITTALALKYFSEAKVDVVILETGLGGRLDATNAVLSDVVVVTPIDFDHQKWLGDTIEQIAYEKAGIIKANVPIISGPQSAKAAAVLRKRAMECEAEIDFITEPDQTHSIRVFGEYQKQNAAVAIAVIRKLVDLEGLSPSGLPRPKLIIDEAAIARGLATVEWPARFQKWGDRTIIDGAHNVAAARTLVETWRAVFPDQRATLILAALSDKDLRGICEVLLPIAHQILLPKIQTERAASPEQLAGIISELWSSLENARATCVSTAPSIARALDLAVAEPNPILITGSLHFAGEVLAFLNGRPAAFEECSQ